MARTNLFAEGDLGATLENGLARLRAEVAAEERNRLLNVDEQAFVKYLVEKYRVEPLNVTWENVYVDDREEEIPAEHFPRDRDFHVLRGKTYPKQIVSFHVPFSGDPQLLKLKPTPGILWSAGANLGTTELVFEAINWENAADDITRERERDFENLRRQVEFVNAQVSRFNSTIESEAAMIVRQRKDQISGQAGFLERLGVKLKPRADVPRTFSIPIRPKSIALKPQASAAPFSPEPTLDDETYERLLEICHHTGVEMERHPDIYRDKKEETLRDHFLMVLASHFENSTGETFNRGGKTDILVRHQGKNLFVAECKFWRGPQGLSGAIDQLLGYLTWRDSKAAILCFVKTKAIGAVLRSGTEAVAAHRCAVRPGKHADESWLNWHFHLPEDETRGVRLAVLSFHLPE